MDGHDAGIEVIYSLVGFMRSYISLWSDYNKLYAVVSWSDVPDRVKVLLRRNIEPARRMFGVDWKTAEHYAPLLSIMTGWSRAIGVLKSVCHDVSLTGQPMPATMAVFIVQLLTFGVCPFDWSYWDTRRCDDEQLFYARCLLSSCVTVLKIHGILKDFEFRLGQEFTAEGVVVSSAVDLLKAFASAVLPHARQTLGTW